MGLEGHHYRLKLISTKKQDKYEKAMTAGARTTIATEKSRILS